MSTALRHRIYEQIDSLTLIDPHTHIDARDPASHTLADILGYHYYTELAHSAGMAKEEIEEPGLDPKEKVARLIASLASIDNTVQYSWLVEMARAFFGFEGDRITPENWEPIYDGALERMADPDWADQVLRQSNLKAVFLTNDFDDPLEGFDTGVYIPCLRADELVFHLADPEVRARLEQATGVAVADAATLRAAIGKLFDHFILHDAKACAISLPPDFAPDKVSAGRATTALSTVCSQGLDSREADRHAVARYVFWTLAEFCVDYGLPFDLMIGVHRGVYEAGVFQGRDLYDSRVSLIQYRRLFNAFPQVTFPVSVLASVTNQELASYAWIFPNVVTHGHWWYSNTPTFIEHDAAARLEAVPRTKQIAYYSDMYKLEFALPKWNMYKRILAKILAERFVLDRGWSEEQAIQLGQQVLRDNAESVFRFAEPPARAPAPAAPPAETVTAGDGQPRSVLDAPEEEAEVPVLSAADREAVQPAAVPEEAAADAASDELSLDEFFDDEPAPSEPAEVEQPAAPDQPIALEPAPGAEIEPDDDAASAEFLIEDLFDAELPPDTAPPEEPATDEPSTPEDDEPFPGIEI